MVFILSFSSFLIGQGDVENSKDIYEYRTSEFDSYDFSIDKKNIPKEGKKFRINYRHNNYKEKGFPFISKLQILRNYSLAITKAGGKVITENLYFGQYTFRDSEQKEIWVEIKPGSTGKYYTITVIEQEPMNAEIEIDAELIKNKIDIDGKITIYGIYFDQGKSKIKEESKAAFVQISEFLKANNEINCWIVGHTDSDGSFEINSKLSLDRANAVKSRLEQNYGISPSRLFAEGVGPLAPIASNNSDAGKKLNRRVELVKK